MAKAAVKDSSDTTMSIKVPASMVHRLDEIAVQTERARSSVARMLITRGLRLFETDGELLDVPLQVSGTVEVKHFGTANKGKR